MQKQDLTIAIKEKALELGFTACGITSPMQLNEDAGRLKKWLQYSFHGNMKYMENHFELRKNPGEIFEGTKSVIATITNYYPEKQQSSDSYKIAKYAYGKDYHFVLKQKLRDLEAFILEKDSSATMRSFVDTAPIFEKTLAAHAGLGWIGKNTLLINRKYGSFTLIGLIFCSLELDYDTIGKDYCGSCTKCLQACPTNALVGPRLLDSNKCISYQTIENREEIPDKIKGKFNDWIFGCDICQDVCPWNQQVQQHTTEAFNPHFSLLEKTKEDWENLSEEDYREVFRKSAVKRAKYPMFMRNVDAAKS